MLASDKFQNFEKAVKRLFEATTRVKGSEADDLLTSGLIQTFEFTIELAWKFLRAYLQEQNYLISSPREAIRIAYSIGYITKGEVWLRALDARNLTSHLYDDNLSKKIVQEIVDEFTPLLWDFYQINQAHYV